jgi:hypothetical protein
VDTSNELLRVRVAGGKKRRRSAEERRKIVEETLQPGASVSRVARRHDAQARVKLVVPQLEKVGKLRQSSTPKAGMTYWMAFSNPTLAVKRGHRVDVVIGSFRANNLVVE